MLRTEEEIRKRLVETMDPESIILFGSRAAGTARAASDFDQLIVTSDGDKPSARRAMAERALSDRAVPLEGLLPRGEPSEQDARRAVSAAEKALSSARKSLP